MKKWGRWWERSRRFAVASRRRWLSRRGEALAARLLRREGLEILARNVRAGGGEVDLVARDGDTIVFVEVKSRTVTAGDERTGLEKIDRRKRTALRRACGALLCRLPEDVDAFRVDGVTVELLQGSWRGRARYGIEWHVGILDLER